MDVSRSFKVCDLTLSSLAELKSNELYALGSWDNNLYIFNMNYGTKVFGESLHDDAISSILFDKHKSILYTGSWDCSVKSWSYKGGSIDTTTEEPIFESTAQISCLHMSSDGNLLLYGDIEGNIQLMDMRDRDIIT
mmetsp:Transcript_8685/g.7636  ORF Transcript_8685/g.7636 Transcript_8685/m.7636 type:complete len:136 (-) Transcript_8685:102-509(-)